MRRHWRQHWEEERIDTLLWRGGSHWWQSHGSQWYRRSQYSKVDQIVGRGVGDQVWVRIGHRCCTSRSLRIRLMWNMDVCLFQMSRWIIRVKRLRRLSAQWRRMDLSMKRGRGERVECQNMWVMWMRLQMVGSWNWSHILIKKLKSLVRLKHRCQCRHLWSSKIRSARRKKLGFRMRGTSTQNEHNAQWRCLKRIQMTQERRLRIFYRSIRVRIIELHLTQQRGKLKFILPLKTSYQLLLKREDHQIKGGVQDEVMCMERHQPQLQMRQQRWKESMIKKNSHLCVRTFMRSRSRDQARRRKESRLRFASQEEVVRILKREWQATWFKKVRERVKPYSHLRLNIRNERWSLKEDGPARCREWFERKEVKSHRWSMSGRGDSLRKRVHSLRRKRSYKDVRSKER